MFYCIFGVIQRQNDLFIGIFRFCDKKMNGFSIQFFILPGEHVAAIRSMACEVFAIEMGFRIAQRCLICVRPSSE